MVFSRDWAAEPEVAKAAPEELTEHRSGPPIAGAYLAGGRTGTLPTYDPAVTPGPPRAAWHDLGVQVRNGNAAATARSAVHCAPGEDPTVTAMVTPAVTKAGTSGTETPLAPLRHESRPGRGRHPATGQFTQGEGVAAGHPSIDSQPKPLSGGGGPQNAQFSQPGMNASGHGCFDHIPRPEPLPITVPVSRLDLRGPAGHLSGIVREPDPTPVSRPSPALDPQAATQHVRATVSLADAVRSHMNRAAVLGIPSDQATGRAPGEA